MLKNSTTDDTRIDLVVLPCIVLERLSIQVGKSLLQDVYQGHYCFQKYSCLVSSQPPACTASFSLDMPSFLAAVEAQQWSTAGQYHVTLLLAPFEVCSVRILILIRL